MDRWYTRSPSRATVVHSLADCIRYSRADEMRICDFFFLSSSWVHKIRPAFYHLVASGYGGLLAVTNHGD